MANGDLSMTVTIESDGIGLPILVTPGRTGRAITSAVNGSAGSGREGSGSHGKGKQTTGGNA